MAEAAAKKQFNFSWEGTDKQGNRVKGKAMAQSEQLVKADLRRQGISPIKIKKQSAAAAAAKGKKITPGDIAIFSRQMATMMGAGVPLVQSFDIIGKGHETRACRNSSWPSRPVSKEAPTLPKHLPHILCISMISS